MITIYVESIRFQLFIRGLTSNFVVVTWIAEKGQFGSVQFFYFTNL